MFFKTNEPHGLAHHPFKACIVPRPIGWVSTQSAQGIGNVAPFSFFNALAQDPPQVMLSFNGTPSGRAHKDTLENIKDTKEFVVNIATYDTMQAMVLTSKAYEPQEDEAEYAELTMIKSNDVSPKRIAQSPIHMECRLTQTISLLSDDPTQPNTMIIGHVIGIHIDDAVLTDGLIDYKKVNPLTRLGYQDYAVIGDIFKATVPWRSLTGQKR